MYHARPRLRVHTGVIHHASTCFSVMKTHHCACTPTSTHAHNELCLYISRNISLLFQTFQRGEMFQNGKNMTSYPHTILLYVDNSKFLWITGTCYSILEVFYALHMYKRNHKRFAIIEAKTNRAAHNTGGEKLFVHEEIFYLPCCAFLRSTNHTYPRPDA
jgi:hypothetical protein